MGPQGAPTVEERRWLDAIVAYGCVACALDGRLEVPPAVHHIVVTGRRLGHRFSLPLCDPGHHQGGGPLGVISLHPGRNPAFIARYGAELNLLRELEDVLGFPRAELLSKLSPPRNA